MLNANKDSHQAEITALQKELENLRGEASDLSAKTVVITEESQEPTEVQDQQQ